MLLSEHVYCVAITFKMTEWVEQRICITFYIGLNIPPQKLFRWFRRLQLWAPENWQLHHDNEPAHASHFLCWVFWQNIKSPRWLSPPTAQIWRPVTSDFSKSSNHLWKGRDFRLFMRFSKIWWASCWRLGELCEVQGVYNEGNWDVIVLCTMFLVSCIFFNVSVFHI